MKRHDFEDLDEMIAELEDSLGVDTAEYLEEDYLDTIGAFEEDDEFDLKELKDLGDDFKDEDEDLDAELAAEEELRRKRKAELDDFNADNVPDGAADDDDKD